MIQPGQNAAFASKPLCKSRVCRQRLRKNLKRYQPLELRLPGFIDKAHAALPNQFHDLQVRKGGAQLLAARRDGLAGSGVPRLGGCRGLRQEAFRAQTLWRIRGDDRTAFWTVSQFYSATHTLS